MTNKTLQSEKYYKLRIDFVIGQYLSGKLSYEEVTENKGKLIGLLDESAKVSNDIKDSLNYQMLNNLVYDN
jgi:hypothetical protein